MTSTATHTVTPALTDRDRATAPPGLRWTPTCLLLAALTGCSTVQVTPLATGQVAVQAFELRGADPMELRQEAAKLCNGRGEVLRESARARYTPTPDGRIARWLQRTVDAVTPADRQAQLVVSCHPEAGRETLALPAPVMPEPAPTGRGNSKGRRAVAADAGVPYGY